MSDLKEAVGLLCQALLYRQYGSNDPHVGTSLREWDSRAEALVRRFGSRDQNTSLDERPLPPTRRTIMDLSNSVIMPREDFVELQNVAFTQTPTSTKERVAQTLQTTIVFAVMAGAVTAGTYGWAKAIERLEDRRFARKMIELDRKENLEK